MIEIDGLNTDVLNVIDKKDAGAFYYAFEKALSKLSLTDLHDIYLYIYHRQAVAISFDADWKPFIGYTSGHNDIERRVPLVGGGVVIKMIKDGLMDFYKILKKFNPREPKGGRVFINKNLVYRHTMDEDFLLLRTIWLGNNNVDANPIMKIIKQIEICKKIRSSELR